MHSFFKLFYKLLKLPFYRNKIKFITKNTVNKTSLNLTLNKKYGRSLNNMGYNMINNRSFHSTSINTINQSTPLLNKEAELKESFLNINLETISSNKYPINDINSLYTFGLQNQKLINKDSKFKEIMNILSRRLIESNIKNRVKFEDGYIEVGEFKNILLLEDNIENLNNINQDQELNVEYGIYDMLLYKQSFEKILLNLNANRV